MPRDVVGEMARDGARVDVVAAADIGADDQLDRFAGVVVGRMRGHRGGHGDKVAMTCSPDEAKRNPG